MSISNEALRKVLVEIEAKSVQSSQQMNIVKAQISAKSREARILQLTSAELSVLPSVTSVYEGVGKMFVQTPTKEVISRLESEDKELKGDVVNLEKKLHYLETTYKNSRDGIERLLKSAGV